MRTLEFTIDDDLWEQFKKGCRQEKRRVTPLSDGEAEEHARTLIYKAIKACVHKTELSNDGSDNDWPTKIDEAFEIAKTIPGILIWEVKGSETCGPTWLVSIHPTEFCETAQGAEQLLAKVKEAKEYSEKQPPMIPVHDWIWRDFKKAYTKQNKDNPKAKDALGVAHDWACRAMQYYIHQGIEDPWTIMDAYEIAMGCPSMTIQKNSNAMYWIVEISGIFHRQAKNANELFKAVKAVKEGKELDATLREIKAEAEKEPCPQRSTRDIICEASAIQGTCPTMVVEELMLGGWIICFRDNDYKGEAHDAEQLLRAVKLAKEYYEVAMENREKHDKDKEEKELREEEDPTIRLAGLPTITKKILLHLIEGLSFKAVTEIAGEPGMRQWDELHIIREKLKDSLAQPERKR